MSFERCTAAVAAIVLAGIAAAAVRAPAATLPELVAGGVTATPTATPLPLLQGQAPPCTGDCNGDGVVTVNELVTGVAIALNRLSVNVCRRLDANGDGRIDVAELVAAVARVLGGCGGTPTPTRTPAGGESVCGGALTSAPKLCNLQIAPARVRRNGNIVISFGISDLEGDVVTICAGIGPADVGPPALECRSLEPAGMAINVAGDLDPIQVGLPVGRYVFGLQFGDSAGHTTELLTAPFEVIQVRV